MSGRLALILGAAVAALVLASDRRETPSAVVQPAAVREIRAGDDVEAIIRERYGDYNETIAQLVKRYNPGLTLPRSASARVLVLPDVNVRVSARTVPRSPEAAQSGARR